MSKPTILVAHDNETIRRVIETLITGVGFGVRSVVDGIACATALESSPSALVLDVAIGGRMAFELIELARQRTPRVPVVLVASIYNRTSYKRRPTSLYGADDYVEQHHLPDALIDKLRALLGTGPTQETTHTACAASREGDLVRAAATLEVASAPVPQAARIDENLRAERLAKLIVSDIALYNGDAFARAWPSGETREAGAERTKSTDELEARLRTDLEEGRLLFDVRVSAAVRRERDFIGEALAELVGGSAGADALVKKGT